MAKPLPPLLIERYRKAQYCHPEDQGAGAGMFHLHGWKGVNYLNAMTDLSLETCRKHLIASDVQSFACSLATPCRPEQNMQLHLPLEDQWIECTEAFETARGLLQGIYIAQEPGESHLKQAAERSGFSLNAVRQLGFLPKKSRLRPIWCIDLIATDGHPFWRSVVELTGPGAVTWLPEKTINYCPYGECYLSPDNIYTPCGECSLVIGFYFSLISAFTASLRGDFRRDDPDAEQKGAKLLKAEIIEEKATYERHRKDLPQKKEARPVEVTHTYHVVRMVNIFEKQPPALRPSRSIATAGRSWKLFAEQSDPNAVWYVKHEIEPFKRHLAGTYWRHAITEALLKAGKELITDDDIERGIDVDVVYERPKWVPTLAKNIRWGFTHVVAQSPSKKQKVESISPARESGHQLINMSENALSIQTEIGRNNRK